VLPPPDEKAGPLVLQYDREAKAADFWLLERRVINGDFLEIVLPTGKGLGVIFCWDGRPEHRPVLHLTIFGPQGCSMWFPEETAYFRWPEEVGRGGTTRK
jgi:hypothetical protein